jgi:hypothetical protein
MQYHASMTTATLWHVINEGIIIGLVLAVELTIRYVRSARRTTFNKAKMEAKNPRELEAITLEQNKLNQFLGLIRLSAILIAVFLSILVYDIQAFSYFVLGVGALIVVLRESVGSLVAYFYILVAYDVGDDIKVGDSLGEISKVSPLYTSVIGKEESGEYNGKLVNIPNYIFLQQKVERQELKTTNYRRATILWTYHRDHAKTPFADIVPKVRAFLDNLLPVRHADEIGFFRNYAGRKYRLVLDFDENGFPTIKITFVAHPDDAGALREKIIGYLETVAHPQKEDSKVATKGE